MACELYCCLLPRCEALRTCRSGFPIATILSQERFTPNMKSSAHDSFPLRSTHLKHIY